MPGYSDEGHIRDALFQLHDILRDLTIAMISVDSPLGKDFLGRLENASEHIRAIRVKGDSKREARADVPTYTKDGDRVS